jgi:hypothetical protein
MNMKYLAGVIALAGVLCFFPACSSDDSTDPNTAAAEALVAGNADLTGKVTVSGETIILNQNITLTRNLTIPAGVTLSVGSKTVTVNDPFSLTVESGGKLTTEAVSKIAVDGDTDGDANTKSYFVLKYGSVFIIDYGEPDRYFSIGGSQDDKLVWDSSSPASKLTTGDGINGIELSGKLGIYKTTTMNMPLIISSGSTLTIETSASYTLRTGSGKLTVNGGTLTINGSLVGKIEDGTPQVIFGSGTIGGSNISIFYPNGSTTPTAAVQGKTYEWNPNAGGTSVAGWKATTP